MAISAAQVKELRERSGAGMMECKKALVETNGDIDAAIDHLRKTGLAKADKKSGRVAAEGQVLLAQQDSSAVLVEINSETDFVAKDENFLGFAKEVTTQALATGKIAIDELMQQPATQGGTLEEARQALVAKIGENIQVRRGVLMSNEGDHIGAYIHGGRIGVLVKMAGGSVALAKDIAMHIAAVRPQFISADDVSDDVINREKEILTAQALESGKPPEIVEKMIGGRIKKFLKEITLLGQPFVKDPDLSVEKLLADAGAKVVAFERLEVGEGIEKKEENFADEVMAQVKG